MSLKLKLNLLITALLAVVFLLGTLLTLYSASRDIHRETESTVELASHFIDAELKRNGFQLAPLKSLLTDLSTVRHLHVRLLDAEGGVIANSLAGQPTISAPAWFTGLVNAFSSPPPAVSRTIKVGGAAVGEVSVAADPSSEIEEIWESFITMCALAAALFLALNGLVYLVVARSLAPLDEVLRGFSELEHGNYEFRLRKLRLSELARIGTLFNEMAQTLEQSRAAQRNFNQKLVEVQDEERRSLARELHDELGQSLAAIHAESCFIAQRAAAPEINESAQAIASATGNMQKLTRSMLQRLRPSALTERGLELSLRELVNSWESRQQRDCSLALIGDLSGLDEKVELTLYRIVQESLTNISRHSDASAVSVSLQRKEDGDAREVKLTISDNGNSAKHSDPGLGLTGIRERVAALGGVLHFAASEMQGFMLEATLPLQAR